MDCVVYELSINYYFIFYLYWVLLLYVMWSVWEQNRECMCWKRRLPLHRCTPWWPVVRKSSQQLSFSWERKKKSHVTKRVLHMRICVMHLCLMYTYLNLFMYILYKPPPPYAEAIDRVRGNIDFFFVFLPPIIFWHKTFGGIIYEC